MRKIRPDQAARSWPFRWRVLLTAAIIVVGLAILLALLGETSGTLRSAEAAPPAQTCPTCPPTPTPTKGAPSPSQSEINGTITLDGSPAAGFSVTIDGRATAQQVTGPNGIYRF